MTPVLTAAPLEIDGIAHGFFSRRGGVSKGVYASLNTGLGSGDDPNAVTQNRSKCAEILGTSENRLLSCYQAHTANVVVVDGPWPGERPVADAMVSTTPHLALGVLAADCMPWLFADPHAGVIGAAHAGWRGALAGVLQQTITEMTKLGADVHNIVAGVGPCLRQENFEVGLDLVDAFHDKYEDMDPFFAPGVDVTKRQFDLVGFGAKRVAETGVREIFDTKRCTFADQESFFSYRGSKRAGAEDYGRNLSAIMLA